MSEKVSFIETFSDLITFEEQIRKVNNVKKELLMGKSLAEVTVSIIKTDKETVDIPEGESPFVKYFSMLPPSMAYTNQDKPAESVTANETGYININEKITLGILDVMLKELTEKRNILLSKIKTEV